MKKEILDTLIINDVNVELSHQHNFARNSEFW